MAKSGLPKKYAKMGFKKGWREFKKSKNKSTRTRTRTKTRTVTTSRKTGGRRMSKTKDFLLGLKEKEIVGGIGYAVAEPLIDQFTSQITPNLPIIGQAGDDIVKVLAGLLGRKFIKNPMAKGMFDTMVTVNTYKVAKRFTPNLFAGVTGSSDTLTSF